MNAPYPPVPPKNKDGFHYFSQDGDPRLFTCSHTGAKGIDRAFVNRLDELRHRCGFPFKISSGYRSPEHPAEAKKPSPGTHAQGIAADILVFGGDQRRRVVEEAIKMGFNGIGVAEEFVHVDARETAEVMWVY